MKKYLLILIIIFSIILIGCAFSENVQNKNQIKLNNAIFDLPNGFYEGQPNNVHDINITNGTYSIFIAEYNESNVTKYIEKYSNYMQETNKKIDIKNYTISGLPVYESTFENVSTNHFWFKINEKTYSIYAWDSNPNLKNITYELIESANRNANN